MKRISLLFIIVCSIVAHTHAQYYDGWVRIDSADRSYQFQVTDATTTQLHSERFYFWFKSGRIHQTQGGYYGKLMHGAYKVTDKEQRLLEQGSFRMGEKRGIWLTWHENGRIKSCTRKRARDGVLLIEEYGPQGSWLKKGYMKNNLFTGLQLELVKGSTIIVPYKKGVRQATVK